MRKLSFKDGSWENLESDWEHICQEYGQSFDEYMTITMPTLKNECKECEDESSKGSYALINDEGKHVAAAWLNCCVQPGYNGKVLRVRHLTLSPEYDFGEYDSTQYAKVLSDVVFDLICMSNESLKSSNLKFHFRSPADVALFREFANNLNEFGHFSSIKMIGSWLEIIK